MASGPSRPPVHPLEAAGAVLALLAGYHFLALRVRAGGLPGGDEGSWLSVAAELARGNGFTTRWLEAHFLEPYALPRPDDFRYPALTGILALAFSVAGFSVEAGRWTVACIHLAFAAAVWGAARAAFGRWAGMAALWLTCCSLLQLEWNSLVYTEGLFGLAAAGLAAWGIAGDRPGADGAPRWRKPGWWAGMGAGVGLLYLVRANGILFLPGIALLWFLRRREVSWRHGACAAAGFLALAGPWMLRSALRFGNPLHIAGNAGLLREPGQSHTLTVAEYFSQYDLLFPLKRMALGFGRFFHALEFYEHGLWILPLVLVLAAAWKRTRFFDPAFAAGCALTFAASVYAAYDSWAGVRYMSGLLPLAYAYGLSAIPPAAAGLTAAAASRRPALPWVLGAAGIALLLLPVLGPHRFYERRFAEPGTELGAPLAAHLGLVDSLVPGDGAYYAASLCRVNFLLETQRCVGLQELYDSTWLARSREAFRPRMIALTRGEAQDSALQAALDLMLDRGYAQDTLAEGGLAIYLGLRPDSSATGLAWSPAGNAP